MKREQPVGGAWNAAADRYRTFLDLLNSLDFDDSQGIARVVEATMSEDFVREDRRRLIALPTVDRDSFAEQVRAWAGLGDGRPMFRLAAVIDVAGDRLAMPAIAIEYASGESVEMLQVIVFDASIRRLQRLVSFDRDDYDAAAGEMASLSSVVQAGSKPHRSG